MPTLSYSLTQTWDRPGTSDLEYWKYADLYDDEKIGAEALGIDEDMWGKRIYSTFQFNL